MLWLKEGDRNSRFFHVKTSQCKRKNCLTILQNAVGIKLEGDLLDKHIVDYFQTLFTANPTKGLMDPLLDMDPRIDDTMSSDLTCDFIDEEVVKTLKQMHPSKAPSPDGMPPSSSNTIDTLLVLS